jgi:hypothetical protein
MKKNVGTLDSILRISIGFIGLAWSISRLSQKNRKANRFVPWMVTVFSALKIAEGINRYCPLLGMFKVSTVNSEIRSKTPHSIAHFPRRKAVL